MFCTLFLLAGLAGCDYGRMYDQDSVRAYERKMPQGDPRSVPLPGGFRGLKSVDPRTLPNPVGYSEQSARQGKQVYAYYCVHCHGPKTDGRGTVGQSFAPLPTDLASADVQAQTDGELYARIRLGFKRHPPLFTTISEEDGWAVVNYVRSLKRGS